MLRAKPAGSLVKGPHAREPDISLRMEVLIPFHAHPNTTYTTYEAEYRGHGISKTVFVLKAHGQPFHLMILKLAATPDLEPSVFGAMSANVTSQIYYESIVWHEETKYHCWIAEQMTTYNRHGKSKGSKCSSNNCTWLPGFALVVSRFF